MQALDVNDLRHRLNSRRSGDAAPPKAEQPQRASLVSQVGQVSRSDSFPHSQAPHLYIEAGSELDFRPANERRTEPAPRAVNERRSGRLVRIEEQPQRRINRQNSRRG